MFSCGIHFSYYRSCAAEFKLVSFVAIVVLGLTQETHLIYIFHGRMVFLQLNEIN